MEEMPLSAGLLPWITSSLLESYSRHGISFVPQANGWQWIIFHAGLCLADTRAVSSQCSALSMTVVDMSYVGGGKLRSSKQLKIVLVCVLMLPSLLPPLFPKPPASFTLRAASLPTQICACTVNFQNTKLLFDIFLISVQKKQDYVSSHDS